MKQTFIHKLIRSGTHSYTITVPKAIIKDLHWREHQKLEITYDQKRNVLLLPIGRKNNMQQYGVDIARERTDDIDKKILSWIEQHRHNDFIPHVLDIGCGQGGQSVRMVQAGAVVHAIDIAAYASTFQAVRANHDIAEEHLVFTQADMRTIASLFSKGTFDACCMQRVLHYIPYPDAVLLLQTLRHIVHGPLYMSVTGLDSDIGKAYADARVPIQERFCVLRPEEARVFQITQPLCLYSPEECMQVLQETGWQIQELWVSAFGNIKALCHPATEHVV